MNNTIVINLTDFDYEKLVNFIDLVERIRQLKFVSELQKNSLFDIIYSRKNTSKPDEESLRSFILDIRKLYMTKESTSFKKMFPVWTRYVDGEEKRELQKCQNDYEENLKISFPAGIPTKESKTIKDIIDDWFYGYYVHEERNKKEALSQLGKAKDFYKWIFMDNLGDFLEFALALENLSKKLLYRNQSLKNN